MNILMAIACFQLQIGDGFLIACTYTRTTSLVYSIPVLIEISFSMGMGCCYMFF
jgi:hypothetical protein